MRHGVRRLVAMVVGTAVAVGLLSAGPGTIAAATGIDLAKPVSDVPAAGTPFVDDGAVMAFAQVGSTVLAGGTFTSVAGSPRRALVAMNAPSYAVSSAFAPVLDGDVAALLPGSVSGTVFVAGSFATVNGEKSKSLALLDTTTGAIVTSFKVPFINGVVNTVKLLGSQLVIGGTFTKVGGKDRGGLASLNVKTGAVTDLVTSTVSGHHNWNGSGAKAAVGVTDLVVTPDGSKIIAIGNFTQVDGLSRDQVVMLDVSGSAAVVRAGWSTNGYTARCYSWAFDSYVRAVDVSPDGSFFAVAATGGGHDGLCDSVARFETNATGANVQPTWTSYTGGDTLHSVAITGSIVYTGGHARWSNNPMGTDYAGAGAVPRPGLQALDARNGIPVSWNPGRNPRGEGAFAVYPTADGLWVGSDTDWIGNFKYKRGKIAMFPLAAGQALADESAPKLPGAIVKGSVSGGTSTVTSTPFDGTSAGSPSTLDSTGLTVSTVRGSTVIGSRLFYGRSDGTFAWRAINGDGSLGAENAIDPYNDPVWSSVDTGSGQTYRGVKPDFYQEIPSVSAMWYDAGALYYTTSGSTVYRRAFSPDSGVIYPVKSTVSSPLPAISGAFLTGGQLFYVAAGTGALWKVGFSNGQFTGSPTQVSGAGGVDWRGPLLYLGRSTNLAPVAAASASCTELACTFSSAGSSDSDGTVTAYSWDFGDATAASSQPNPTHTYAGAGTYSVTLTVTDDRGASATKTISVTASLPSSPVSFVGATSTNTAAKAPTVTLPSAVATGDRLLLVATSNTATTAGAPAGWTQVQQVASAGMLTTVWQRAAVAADRAGDQVAVTFDVWTKSDVTLLAYRGAGEVTTVASKVLGAATTHVAPSVTVSDARSWLFTYWAVKGTGIADLTADARVTKRSVDIAQSSPGISALAGDSGGGVATGATGTRSAATDVAGARDVGLTIVLPPAS